MEREIRKSDFDTILKIVKIQRYPTLEELPLPAYQSEFAAGMDLCADIESKISIAAGAVQLVPTGLRMEIPHGYEGQIRPRSGLATKKRLTVVNSPGTIDRDFRGEVVVALINLGDSYQFVNRGDRIAQLVIAPVTRVIPKLVQESELSGTGRGEGGFGSTGA